MATFDQCCHSSVNGSLSIDRLTLLFYCPMLSLWNNGNDNSFYVQKMRSLIERVLYSDLDPDFPQGSSTDLFAHHFRTVSGYDIQFGTKMPKRKKITDENYILAFGTAQDRENGFAWKILPNEYAFRVEFNPNKSENFASLSPLFSFFDYCPLPSQIRVARIDIAVDYPVEINPTLILVDKCRKSFTATGSSGLESVYFGTRSSKNYFRIYNKRQELFDNEGLELDTPLWRIELECKESFFLNQNPDHLSTFQRIRLFEPSVRSGDWCIDLIQQQASLVGIQNVLRTMPPATQQRYRKIFKEFNYQNLLSPSFIYSRDFPFCLQKLRSEILLGLGYDLIDCASV